MPSDPVIYDSDGWFPPDALVEEVRAAAKAKGLISDWPIISVLKNHDLLLCCTHVTGEFGSGLVAHRSADGKWTFKTDSEEMGESWRDA